MTSEAPGGIWRWLGSSSVEVTCHVDIEHSFDSLHAHAIPDGIELQPGDMVLVHGAPTTVPYGERVRLECRATVYRAGRLERFWTQILAFAQLTELYHCGFEPKEAAA
jgi:hypothetical protein